MRLLVISHKAFDFDTSMGKTLSKLFEGCENVDIAQFYIRNENPCRMDICRNYFRISDKEALISVFTRADIGKAFNDEKIDCHDNCSGVMKFEKKIYQYGRMRTPLMYLIRDFFWKCSNWNNQRLHKWIVEFNPDVIFLASGDYSFIYNIARKISDKISIPLVVMCFDDYYIFNINEKKLLGKIRHNLFMHTVKKTILKCKCIITVCEPMAREYEKLFNKKCYVLYTSAEMRDLKTLKESRRIAYFGSLGLGRDKQLIDIGKTLQSCNIGEGICGVDVYSDETRKSILDNMTPDNGIFFHGKVSQDEMHLILAKCLAVIHTESFDPIIRERTRFSISTKIAETIASGPCLFAYGPEEIASIRYLSENKAAIIAVNKNELKEKLNRMINDTSYREITILRARELAQKNHDTRKNSKLLKDILDNALDRVNSNENSSN